TNTRPPTTAGFDRTMPSRSVVHNSAPVPVSNALSDSLPAAKTTSPTTVGEVTAPCPVGCVQSRLPDAASNAYSVPAFDSMKTRPALTAGVDSNRSSSGLDQLSGPSD